MKDEEVISRLIEFEDDIRYQESASEDEPEYRHIAGKSPILVSAPHGAVHTRDGKLKEEDEFTAGFAQLLGEKTNAHVLYARRKSLSDPNVDPEAPYKKYLEEILTSNEIRVVIDLHGANEKKLFGIALGTMRGESCTEEERQIIIKVLESFGFLKDNKGLSCLDVDNAFPAMGDENRIPITRFCHELNISAAQIELNAHLRIPQRREDATHANVPFEGSKEMIGKAVRALSEVVFSLEKHYS